MTAPRFDPGIVDQLETLLAWRRDVRHFQTTPLPEGTIDRLLALAHHAPSVGNARPWRFVRITSPGIRQRLADHVDGQVQAARDRYAADDARLNLYERLKLHGLREAPEAIAVFSDAAPAAGHGLGIATMPEALEYSTVLAIHTLWLAARASGIGLGWVSIVDPDFVTAQLDVPPSWRFVALLCLGYPVEPSCEPELQRRGWQSNSNWADHVHVR